ncbi:MAG: anhydro-N-acetylmuramic acid kinase [Pseudomonadota bacterium]
MNALLRPSSLYIGLMSGTSVDAIDGILVDFSPPFPKTLGFASLPMSSRLREDILALCLPGDNEIDRMGSLGVQLGELFAQVANTVIAEAGVDRQAIAAIGSHGQTIRHRPALPYPFTLQIADPSVIAQLTGITTVADFRSRDLAAGGQGAPLVPAFHAAVFRAPAADRCVLNLGGIANITVIPADRSQPIRGFDTGPGNLLMNAWIAKHRHEEYDKDGAWAAAGTCDERLLSLLLSDPYFSLPPPKSTGREYFNVDWLMPKLGGHPRRLQDVQATLCALTVQSVRCAVLEHAPSTAEVLVCGGGAYNGHLMNMLEREFAPVVVKSTEALGIAPKQVEAMAFAWLAKQTLSMKPGNLPSVTGASMPVILGGIYPGNLADQR